MFERNTLKTFRIAIVSLPNDNQSDSISSQWHLLLTAVDMTAVRLKWLTFIYRRCHTSCRIPHSTCRLSHGEHKTTRKKRKYRNTSQSRTALKSKVCVYLREVQTWTEDIQYHDIVRSLGDRSSNNSLFGDKIL